MPYNKFIPVQVLDLEAIAGGTPVHGKGQCIHIYTLGQFSIASPPTDFLGEANPEDTHIHIEEHWQIQKTLTYTSK